VILNVGGQQTRDRYPQGWICVDILPGADYYCDVSKMELPFKNETCEAIYCSHMLEHIWSWRQDFVMSEFFRVLKHNCPIRIVVPDMDIAINNYVANRADGSPGRLAGCMDWWFDPQPDKDGNGQLSHVYGFNWFSMHFQVTRAGFINVIRSQYNKGSQVFSGCDNPGHEHTSLYVEAIKS